jgi:hypothetical protein
MAQREMEAMVDDSVWRKTPSCPDPKGYPTLTPKLAAYSPRALVEHTHQWQRRTNVWRGVTSQDVGKATKKREIRRSELEQLDRALENY